VSTHLIKIWNFPFPFVILWVVESIPRPLSYWFGLFSFSPSNPLGISPHSSLADSSSFLFKGNQTMPLSDFLPKNDVFSPFSLLYWKDTKSLLRPLGNDLAFLVLFSLEQKCCLDDGTVPPTIIYNDPARQMDLAPSHLAGFSLPALPIYREGDPFMLFAKETPHTMLAVRMTSVFTRS